MNKKRVIRLTDGTFRGLITAFNKGEPADEKFAFALCSTAEGPTEIIHLVRVLLLPGPDDMDEQSPGGVSPSREFQTLAYGLAEEMDCDVFDFHTHPFSELPHFSSIDDGESMRNARFLHQHFKSGSSMGLLVFNRELNVFQGRFWNRALGGFEDIGLVEVLGKRILQIPNEPVQPSPMDEKFARHLLIPGWNQDNLARLKVAIVGLGGNGANILQALLSLGVGAQGCILACDPQKIEPSNLARIPYAFAGDVGKSKAAVAGSYAQAKGADSYFKAFECEFQDPSFQECAKEAHVVIENLDSDWDRKDLNAWAIRNLIPIISTAAEVIPGEERCEAGGQIRIIEPGTTACLLCSGTLELSEGNPRALSEDQRTIRRQAGYIRGLDETATPSVLDLNGVTSHLAISHLRRMVFGEPLNDMDYVFYDRQACSLIAAALPEPDENCPTCGTRGCLGSGDLKPGSHENESDRTAPIRFEMGHEVVTVESECIMCPDHESQSAETNGDSDDNANRQLKSKES